MACGSSLCERHENSLEVSDWEEELQGWSTLGDGRGGLRMPAEEEEALQRWDSESALVTWSWYAGRHVFLLFPVHIAENSCYPREQPDRMVAFSPKPKLLRRRTS